MHKELPEWTIAGLLVAAIGVVLVGLYAVRLFELASSGEQLGALAAVAGGFIGAAGAALAVFLTLRSQREDEAETIRDAARREIQEFSRLVAGNLEVCSEIAAGTVRIPASALPAAMRMSVPTIYRAIANRIGRLDRADSYVTFYARIAEAERLVEILAGRMGTTAGTELSGGRIPPPLPVRKADVALIAAAWIDVGGLAAHILTPQPRPENFADGVNESFRERLQQALERAQTAFPQDSNDAI